MNDFTLTSKLTLIIKFQSGTKIVRKQGCGSIERFLSLIVRYFLSLSEQRRRLLAEYLKRVGWPGKSVTSASVLVAIYEIRRMIDCKCLYTIPNEGYLLEPRPAVDILFIFL